MFVFFHCIELNYLSKFKNTTILFRICFFLYLNNAFSAGHMVNNYIVIFNIKQVNFYNDFWINSKYDLKYNLKYLFVLLTLLLRTYEKLLLEYIIDNCYSDVSCMSMRRSDSSDLTISKVIILLFYYAYLEEISKMIFCFL